jgi:DNA-binding NarL/FixJ family response regulator
MADVVTLIQDMLFSSKVREAAKATGASVQSTRDVAALVAAARDARLVIVDLRLPTALAALDALAAAGTSVTILGFIDHEKTDVMAEARARGCTQVMAKGQFASALPKLISSLHASRPGPPDRT